MIRAGRCAAVIAVVIALTGCAHPTSSAVDGVRVSGSIYTDFRVDTPCDQQQAPVELTGVQLSFRDGAGTLIGTALTGLPERVELPKEPGMETWAHGGCRMRARYAVDLPASEVYSVEFKPATVPRRPDRPYFQGVDELKSQTSDAAELASRGFVWDFEAPAAFVVP